MTPSPDGARRLLAELGDHLRGLLISARGIDMAAVEGRTAADTIYAIDRVADEALAAWFEGHWTGVELVSEGLDEPVVIGDDPAWTVIVDTIDGTRGLMYDKRPAWCLAAAAPRGGSLRSVVAAAMTELPTTKQGAADQLSATRGGDVMAERIDLTTGARAPLGVRPSAATDLEHGFGGLAKFFVPGKAVLAELEAELFRRLGCREVFDDEYISSGGQLHELLTGRDRFVADLRPLAAPEAHACHPYDVCTLLLLEEAGGVVTGPWGEPLDTPLDTTSPVAWVGYANQGLAAWIGPVLAELVDERFGGYSAPGRLDVLGGVADYSGALVLETPTQLTTTVTAAPADALEVGPARLAEDDVVKLTGLTYPEVRDALADLPGWTHYVVGVALVLVRHGIIAPPLVRLTVTSDIPPSVGVSSSAALEVATARALGGDVVDPLRLAALCQEAENHVVGVPCGIMDQVTVAVGTPGRLLPVLCRPASVSPELALPPGVEAVGWPTGAEHDIGGGPYRRARAAAFMGKRMVESTSGRTWDWVSDLPPALVGELPDAVAGADFLDRFGATEDDVTSVEADEVYPVGAATAFGVEEHARTREASLLLAAGDVGALRPHFAASHAGYDAMGLGHPAATAVVDQALVRPGVHGARSSGGGSGGTVVVLGDKGALDDVEGLIR